MVMEVQAQSNIVVGLVFTIVDNIYNILSRINLKWIEQVILKHWKHTT